MKSVNVLGVYVSKNLSWDCHVCYVKARISELTRITDRLCSVLLKQVRNLDLQCTYIQCCHFFWSWSILSRAKNSLKVAKSRRNISICNYRDWVSTSNCDAPYQFCSREVRNGTDDDPYRQQAWHPLCTFVFFLAFCFQCAKRRWRDLWHRLKGHRFSIVITKLEIWHNSLSNVKTKECSTRFTVEHKVPLFHEDNYQI